MKEPLLPGEPLLRAVERWRAEGGVLSDAQEKALARVRRRGVVGFYRADALCCHILRAHPASVYGRLYWTAGLEADTLTHA